MKNKYLLALVALTCISKISNAQQLVSSWYTFTSTASTYVAINGNVLGTNTNDDDTFNGVPLGFAFNFNGVNLNTISVNANGYIKMGGTLNNFSTNPIDDVFGDDSLICALGSDLVSNVTGVLSYTTTGVAPNRVFTVDWSDYSSNFGNDDLFFQIKLYETTNVIDVIYGSMTLSQYSSSEVGLRGSNFMDFNNRSVLNGNNTWAASAAGINNTDYCELDPGPPSFNPVSGQKYTWSPPPICTGTPLAGNVLSIAGSSACVGQALDLFVTGGTLASGLNYQWQSSPNGTSWTSIPSGTNYAYNPTYATPIYYRAIVGCSTATVTTNSINIGSTPIISYAPVPFLENFDNVWQNRCDLRNVPTAAYWSSNPTTGDSSWRRQDDGISANWASSGATVTPFSGSGCADFDTYDAAFGTAGELDLYVNMGTSSNYTVSFYHINADGDDSLEVFLSTNGGASFTKKSSYLSGDYDPLSSSWTRRTIALTAVNSPSCVLKFKSTSDFGFSDIGMDSLKIVSNCSAPALTATGATTICLGTAVTLTVSGANNYIWNTGATASSITVSPLSDTIYVVTGLTNNCGSSQTVSVSVTSVNVNIATTASTLCLGSSAILSGSGASSYTWTNNNSTLPVLNVTPTVSTVYTLIGKFGACYGTGSISLVVNANPTVTASPPSSTICAGESVTITASGASSYTWSLGPNTASVSASPASTTNYYVLGKDLATGCLGLDTVVVVVNPLPALSVNNVTLCSSTTAILTASGAATYSWSTGSTAPFIAVTPTVNTSYMVTGYSSQGCTNTALATVSIGTAVNISVFATNTLLCSGDTAILTASGANNYLWNATVTGPSLAVFPTSNTDYIVVGTNGLCSDSKTISVTVNPKPLLNLSSSSSTICIGNSAILKATGAFSYSWSTGVVSSSISVSPSLTTTYFVIGTNTNSCKSTSIILQSVDVCTGINAVSITSGSIKVYPNPNNGLFVIETEGSIAVGIEVTDIAGQVVRTVQPNRNTNSLDITELKNGFYLVRVKEEDGNLKIIKIIKD